MARRLSKVAAGPVGAYHLLACWKPGKHRSSVLDSTPDKVVWCSHHYLLGNENGGKTLDIAFKTRKLAAACNTERTLKTTYGDPMAKTIMRRLAVLRSARTLSRVPRSKPERRRQLTGDRSGQYAVDLVQPYRLIFVPDHNPLPRLDDGGIDTDRVTAITIMEIADYH